MLHNGDLEFGVPRLNNSKPIILASHARACSTAFERMFIQNPHVQVLHEPFGDAFWLGPERQLRRYEEVRDKSGYADITYKDVVEWIDDAQRQAQAQNKFLFIKDMAFDLMPAYTSKDEPKAAPSFGPPCHEPGNPTLLPKDMLGRYCFTFLIRHPKFSCRSYYSLSLPEHMDSRVGTYNSDDAGYAELRKLFEYLKNNELIGPLRNGEVAGPAGSNIVVIDAQDLLENPEATVAAYCRQVGIPYDPGMLSWGDASAKERAVKIINRWGFEAYFHRQVLASDKLGSDSEKKEKSPDNYDGWVAAYGQTGADEIQKAVDRYLPDYDFLKQYAIKI